MHTPFQKQQTQDAQENKSETYLPLGPKTFAVLIIQRSLGIGVLFIGFIALAGVKSSVPAFLGQYIDLAISFGLVAILGIAFLILLTVLLEYRHYGVILEQDAFRIRRGAIVQTETGIPYRRIKEVNMQRTAFDQIFGTSTIVITVLGEGEGQTFADESQHTLPWIEAGIADEIRNHILAKGGRLSSNA